MTEPAEAVGGTLLLHPGPVDRDALVAALRAELPGLRIRFWSPEARDGVGPGAEARVGASDGAGADAETDAVEYALVSRIEPRALARFRQLRFIASLHAGVDHLLGDDTLDAEVPIVKPAPIGGDVLMNEYVLAQVLRHHRDMPAYAEQQRHAVWRRHTPRGCATRTVGVLGMGALGAPVADLLRRVGFDVCGWARRPRAASSVPVLGGPDGLNDIAARSEILVNLLPLTPETAGLLNASLFARMPRGAAVVNVGRGEHVVDADLLAALDSGQLGAATLDVFRREPLEPAHPFWAHPRIAVTPHACRVVDIDALARQTADNIRRSRAGEPLIGRVDRRFGY